MRVRILRKVEIRADAAGEDQAASPELGDVGWRSGLAR